MKVLKGSIVTEMHGKLGGHVATTSKGSTIFSKKRSAKRSASSGLQAQNMRYSAVNAAWKALSQYQIKSWNNFAVDGVSGIEAFREKNLIALSNNLSILTDPVSGNIWQPYFPLYSYASSSIEVFSLNSYVQLPSFIVLQVCATRQFSPSVSIYIQNYRNIVTINGSYQFPFNLLNFYHNVFIQRLIYGYHIGLKYRYINVNSLEHSRWSFIDVYITAYPSILAVTGSTRGLLLKSKSDFTGFDTLYTGGDGTYFLYAFQVNQYEFVIVQPIPAAFFLYNSLTGTVVPVSGTLDSQLTTSNISAFFNLVVITSSSGVSICIYDNAEKIQYKTSVIPLAVTSFNNVFTYDNFMFAFPSVNGPYLKYDLSNHTFSTVPDIVPISSNQFGCLVYDHIFLTRKLNPFTIYKLFNFASSYSTVYSSVVPATVAFLMRVSAHNILCVKRTGTASFDILLSVDSGDSFTLVYNTLTLGAPSPYSNIYHNVIILSLLSTNGFLFSIDFGVTWSWCAILAGYSTPGNIKILSPSCWVVGCRNTAGKSCILITYNQGVSFAPLYIDPNNTSAISFSICN